MHLKLRGRKVLLGACGVLIVVIFGIVLLTSSDGSTRASSTFGMASATPATLIRGESIPLADAVLAADPRIKMPRSEVVGQIERVTQLGTASVSNDAPPPREEIGIAVQFASGTVLTAFPLDPLGPAPDYHAMQAQQEAEGVTFTDGRKRPGEVRTINGRATWVRPAGTQRIETRDGYIDEPLPSVVMWVDNGISYLLTSDTQSIEQLVKIATSMD